jgi:subtilase family serine protease
VPDGGAGCRFDSFGNVVILVRNQGQADAPGTLTRIESQVGLTTTRAGVPGAADIETPPIPAGGSAPVAFSRTLLSSAGVRVTVDLTERVNESREDNNTAAFTCAPR